MWCCANLRKMHGKQEVSATTELEELSLVKTARHLVCDDSSLNRRILKRVLFKMLEVEVDEADSGPAAVQQVLEHGEYAIIWMDIGLGTNQENGAEVSKRLREILHYKGIIIALTGFTDKKNKEMCMQSGMNHFVPKPFDSATIKQYGERYALVSV
jgi:osomolarity two-component system, sensor histidine kinase SLN1